MPIAFILLAAASGAQASAATGAATPASVTTGDREGAAALALFQRDAALNYWALKHYDVDGDILLSEPEAAAAAAGFKAIADGDSDGRVTTYEYDRAKEYIVARF
jgi:hypothetical protein